MGFPTYPDNQVSTETNATNATATPAPARTYPRLLCQKLRNGFFGPARRRAGAFVPWPSLRADKPSVFLSSDKTIFF